jgi:hypothetical protein
MLQLYHKSVTKHATQTETELETLKTTVLRFQSAYFIGLHRLRLGRGIVS